MHEGSFRKQLDAEVFEQMFLKLAKILDILGTIFSGG